MVTVVDLTLPGDALPLGDVLLEDEDARIKPERMAPISDDVLPFFWISDGSVGNIERALAEESTVESTERLASVDGRHLYAMEWAGDLGVVVESLEATDGVILDGVGEQGRWELRIRFPSHDRLREFADRCRASDVRFDVGGIYNPHVPTAKDVLTPTQWETLNVAYERGYFEVPRQSTLADLSEQFGVTEQAVSQRLRRALNGLVGSVRFDSP
ncbi:helix-turn-helix domain-containing protein [Halomarina salina]|uniref:Helix-turn-helix domain-containing protein n=1 Tax=Halomarina salina TaxID=1872699 RepID=A0ABD5RS45_9EURY|nr:helix-turn-helix domain-containing protein [Halomarina salina]